MSKKIIKLGKKVIVVLDDGSYYEKADASPEDAKALEMAQTEEEVVRIVDPARNRIEFEIKNKKAMLENLLSKVTSSNILSLENDCIYWRSVSGFSIPEELAERILQAEENNDTLKIETYKNFWTLMSLNPDETCRKNLFWFLTKWGLVIARCGFFVAYRNMDYLETVDGEDIYTDQYTRSFRIKIGSMVTMDRAKCDSNNEVICSTGLHLGGREWLDKNYFGNTGMICLCNPASVTAVPKYSDYGKLRTCAYLPIKKAEFGSDGHIIPLDVEDGFDCSYVTKVIYEGLMGSSEDSSYKIVIPEVPEIDRVSVTDKLLQIAKDCITNRNI